MHCAMSVLCIQSVHIYVNTATSVNCEVDPWILHNFACSFYILFLSLSPSLFNSKSCYLVAVNSLNLLFLLYRLHVTSVGGDGDFQLLKCYAFCLHFSKSMLFLSMHIFSCIHYYYYFQKPFSYFCGSGLWTVWRGCDFFYHKQFTFN